jgi:hypothetical protein
MVNNWRLEVWRSRIPGDKNVQLKILVYSSVPCNCMYVFCLRSYVRSLSTTTVLYNREERVRGGKGADPPPAESRGGAIVPFFLQSFGTLGCSAVSSKIVACWGSWILSICSLIQYIYSIIYCIFHSLSLLFQLFI